MKFLAVFLLFFVSFSMSYCSLSTHKFSDEELHLLANLDLSKISKELRDYIENYKTGDNSNYCCAITYADGWTGLTSTSIYFVTNSFAQAYQYSCGFLGVSTCTGYRVAYRQDVLYKQNIVYKPVTTPCPETQIVCCNGYMWVAKNCMPQQWVMDNIQTLLLIYSPLDFKPPGFSNGLIQ